MHISQIHYVESQSVETFTGHGLREWNKKEYAVTVSINEKEDVNKADELAKQFVKEKLAKQVKPQFATEMQPQEPDVLPIIQEKKVTPGMQYAIGKIKGAKTIEELENERTRSDLNPAIKEEFNKKMILLKVNEGK